ncbi:MAG: hypothetical protein AAGG55_05830 [Pseudomonadota bacterium]
MNDDFSISYVQHPKETHGSAQEDSRAEELYAFADCELIGIDSRKMLVINRTTGEQRLFEPGVVEALKSCSRFRTLREHTARICQSRSELSGRETMVEATLADLASTHFLLPASTVGQRLTSNASSKVAESAVFVITCDRPDAVGRLMESMLRNSSLNKHSALYLVDDSRTPENQIRNAELVRDFNIRCPRDMTYFGAAEQTELLTHLVTKLPKHEGPIRFLLDSSKWEGKKTYGRARTFCLLLSVGRRALVLDDDITCESIAPPMKNDGISFKGERHASFYQDRDDLQNSTVSAGVDPLLSHLEILGHTVGSVIESWGGDTLPQSLEDCNAAMLLEVEGNHPVLITQCGSWGDPGTGDAHWPLNLGETSIERLASAAGGMVNAMENRCSWLGCSRLTLHKMAFLSQMTGLDNSQLLPPYFPAYRCEDLLFAAMVEAMYPQGAIFEMGWSVPHLPIDERTHSIKEPIVGEGGTALLVRWLISRIEYRQKSSPEARLFQLANLSRDLASKSSDDLLIDYRREQAQSEAEFLHKVVSKLKDSEQLPSLNWQSYLKRAAEEAERSIGREHSPLDLPGIEKSTTEESLVDLFRDYATIWADALEVWPQIRDAASDWAD